MNNPSLVWWAALCTVALCNVLAWSASALHLQRRRATLDAETQAFRQRQMWLSAAYVFGCAFRSALPVFDVPRLAMVDSWLSSAAVGRSVATLAEVCFAMQWALLLREASRIQGSSLGRAIAGTVVPLIVVAEVCSWHAVLSTSNLGHVIEESLWGVSALLIVLGLLAVARTADHPTRLLFKLYAAAGLAYAGYMFAVDVPMYAARWWADEAVGRVYMDLLPGLADAASRWTVSHRWDDWRGEAVWMSLYFSTAVWLSIGLMHVPLPRGSAPRQAPAGPARRSAAAHANWGRRS